MVTLLLKKVYDFLSSARLALFLLVFILISCVAGASVMPVAAARTYIFSSVWFNLLLVFLIINVVFCFFPRIWSRKIDFVFAGMIIFHLSFVLLFIGIVYDSLFYFRGALRLTEGETLELGDSNAYDQEEWGLFFKHAWMRGDVTFHKHLINYKAGGQDKGVAHEISIVEGPRQVRGAIYPTHNLKFSGFRFYHNKDGFAPLFVLYDKNGRELYGAYVPLQSFKLKKDMFLYTTGTKQEGPGSTDFPQIQNIPPLFKIQFTYHLPKLKNEIAKASFKIWEYSKDRENGQGRLVFEGTTPLGEKVAFGDYALSMKELRYWASMDVLYNPGQPIVLASLWVGLSGIILTTVSRLVKRK